MESSYLCTCISKGMQIFLLLNFSDELQPQTRFNEQIQIHIEAAHHSADFNHSVFGAVAGLSENMGRGLRFLYAHTDSASPTDLRDESNNKISNHNKKTIKNESYDQD